MMKGSYNGIHLAGLLSASALYAGILGYLHLQGTDSLDNAQHGLAVNDQLAQDLDQRRQTPAGQDQPAVADRSENDAGIVKPMNGGIFASAATDESAETGASTENSQPTPQTRDIAAATATTSAVVSGDAQAGAAQTGAGTAATPAYSAGYAAQDAYAIPAAYYPQADTYWVDAAYAPAVLHDGRGYYDGYGRGDGQGRGRGRGNWDGDGEFSFSMRFKSRLRADGDVDADSGWNADSEARAWQDAQQRLWWQHYQAARYYSANR